MAADEDPPGYPRAWEADVVLRDGSVAQVRPIRPSDGPALQEFHAGQSDESIYLRFFAPLKRLSDKDIHRFTHVDYRARVALVMIAAGDLVAIARYDRLAGPDGPRAEVAFNVSDRFQGRGAGSVLLEHLAAIGREAGVKEFVADVLPQNRKMMGVFLDAGYLVEHGFDDGVISLSFPIRATRQSEDVRVAREQRAESQSVRALLNPASVAVVGVSRSRGSAGRDLFTHLVRGGFTGQVYAVSSSGAAQIEDHPVYASVRDIPEPVELAVIAVPAGEVHDVLLDCAGHGVRAVVVISAGFAEVGEQGAALQHELLRTARRLGLRVVGPNSFGVLNTRPEVRLNASLAPEMPPAGSLGLFSQSGALAIAVLDSATRRGLGISDFVSAGNRVDVSGNDVMQHWIDDDTTTAVGLYLESMGNPRKFNRIARRLAALKPVIVVKSGMSAYGVPPGHRVRATQTRPEAFAAMLAQAGVMRVENVHQLFDIAQLVVHQPIPRGNRVAIVGNSDALGALAADSCVAWGLQVSHGPVNLPAEASAEEFRQAVSAAFEDPDVDSVVTAFIPPRALAGVAVAQTLAIAALDSGKPCITTFLGIRGVTDALSARAADGTRQTVPAYAMPEDGIRALAAATQYGQWRDRDRGEPVSPEGISRTKAEQLIDRVLAGSPRGRALTADETRELLGHYGIEVWPSFPVQSAQEAVETAERLGYPVVLKSVSPIARTQPVTAVRTDLVDAAAVRQAYAALDARLVPLHADRYVVQRMATPGIACVIASSEDPLFGPMVRFGLSGAPTEVMGDIGYRIPPLRESDVLDLIGSVRAAPLLNGRDGLGPADRAALADLIARVSVLADDHPELASIELTSVNCHRDGADVLGASVHLAPAFRSDSDRRTMTVDA
ncbi:GNAT family N-acetyltransferase [Calidifontibacter sp. DB0510]|uniref:GNAT family N-acetyltransferase n=1 Tax=Metallococcus carri TaxID=1656884 RepID=A0A967B2Q4_9MICO|nr:bifunctional GNAT family N-acetyltransferase/acetate--CoA ligase family protein [Metallococcus carri]NHN56889.1 GNAT family N-acetyltransferase [Metallococcus carri]NOP37634.1 GNAT family N-acetyltransferase [Calidifontibacter sp. DB2511S]